MITLFKWLLVASIFIVAGIILGQTYDFFSIMFLPGIFFALSVLVSDFIVFPNGFRRFEILIISPAFYTICGIILFILDSNVDETGETNIYSMVTKETVAGFLACSGMLLVYFRGLRSKGKILLCFSIALMASFIFEYSFRINQVYLNDLFGFREARSSIAFASWFFIIGIFIIFMKSRLHLKNGFYEK